MKQLNPSIGRLQIASASGSIGGGKYRVFASLGRGGMADVHLGAVQGPKGFNKLVVVKRLRPLLADDPVVVNMFLDEARLAARLNHPNVIHTYEFGEERGSYFIAMEYLDGQSLAAILLAVATAGKVVAPAFWAKIVADALAGLHHAHELRDYDGTPLKVVHRDVSPQNIVITHAGQVKLVDFGIAKAKLNLTETESQIIKGKIAYMAPEQAEGEALDRRADVFAMGIVLWECLAGKRLITGDAQSAMTQLAAMVASPPSKVDPRVPPELDAITLRALERAPAKRFQTAQEMRDALEKYLRSREQAIGEVEIGGLVDALFAHEHEDVKRDIMIHMERLGSERELAVAAPEGDVAAPIAPAKSAPRTTAETLEKLHSHESAGSLRAVRTSSLHRTTERQGGWGARAAAGIAVVGLLVWGVLGVRSGSKGTAGAPAAPLAPSPAAPALVHLVVRASPPDAQIDVDGADVQNPFAGTFARDDVQHRVHAARPGYLPITKLARFDQDDVSLDLTLEKPPEPSSSGASAPKPTPPATSSARPPKTQPKLDDDPWR